MATEKEDVEVNFDAKVDKMMAAFDRMADAASKWSAQTDAAVDQTTSNIKSKADASLAAMKKVQKEELEASKRIAKFLSEQKAAQEAEAQRVADNAKKWGDRAANFSKDLVTQNFDSLGEKAATSLIAKFTGMIGGGAIGSFLGPAGTIIGAQLGESAGPAFANVFERIYTRIQPAERFKEINRQANARIQELADAQKEKDDQFQKTLEDWKKEVLKSDEQVAQAFNSLAIARQERAAKQQLQAEENLIADHQRRIERLQEIANQPIQMPRTDFGDSAAKSVLAGTAEAQAMLANAQTRTMKIDQTAQEAMAKAAEAKANEAKAEIERLNGVIEATKKNQEQRQEEKEKRLIELAEQQVEEARKLNRYWRDVKPVKTT